MWTLLLGAALAANPYADRNADIVASRAIQAPAADLYARLSDLRALQTFMTPLCASDWVHGDQSQGVGASATWVYHARSMHRKLTATISKVKEDRMVELDHAGKKGFISRFSLEPSEDGATNVTLTTYINQPPWPFRGAYFNDVQPSWQRCQEATLESLAKAVE